MIGVVVTFGYEHPIDHAAFAGIAHGASERLRGMPGRRSTASTINPEHDEATNFDI